MFEFFLLLAACFLLLALSFRVRRGQEASSKKPKAFNTYYKNAHITYHKWLYTMD